jgi:hypothetical protein
VRARKQVEQARGVRVSRRRQLNSFLGWHPKSFLQMVQAVKI